MPHVEDGTVILLGATTENPYFSVNAPLLSRSRLFRLEPLTDEDIAGLLDRALADAERGLGNENLALDPDARSYLAGSANGDARAALTALEIAASLALTPGPSENADAPSHEAGSVGGPGSGKSVSKPREQQRRAFAEQMK